MNYRAILSPEAKADLSSIVLWYLRTDPKLAFRFTLETLDTLRRIEQFPYAFPLRYGTLRCAVLNEFPYVIYYLVNSSRVFVRAIVHQRRADFQIDGSNGSKSVKPP